MRVCVCVCVCAYVCMYVWMYMRMPAEISCGKNKLE